MSAPGAISAPVGAPDADLDGDLRCSVCEHPAAAHDTISRRYCQATESQAVTRRCICPG
jgi:hypothetical protein